MELEDGPRGQWFFHNTDDDGVFIKVNGNRAMNKAKELIEEVTDVRVGRMPGKVEIICRNPRRKGGYSSLVFDLKNFTAPNVYSTSYVTSCNDSQAFVDCFYKNTFSQDIPRSKIPLTVGEISPSISSDEYSDTPATSSIAVRRKSKKVKRKIDFQDVKDLPSPSARKKAFTVDEHCLMHKLGTFYVSVQSLIQCKQEWLDRPVEQAYINYLVEVLKKDISAMQNMQPLLVVTDIKKDGKCDLQTLKAMIKGSSLKVIGGVYRMHAFKQLLASPGTPQSLREAYRCVWVNAFDSTLTDEEVKRLAFQHNTQNVGSKETAWIDRVATCRSWLYSINNLDINEELEVPCATCTREWKFSCQKMYVPNGVDKNTLEPTLQAALLSKETWKVFKTVAEMFKQRELKGMEGRKRSRTKKELQIKQHQLGMPLQGLSEDTKVYLLKQVQMKEKKSGGDGARCAGHQEEKWYYKSLFKLYGGTKPSST